MASSSRRRAFVTPPVFLPREHLDTARKRDRLNVERPPLTPFARLATSVVLIDAGRVAAVGGPELLANRL